MSADDSGSSAAFSGRFCHREIVQKQMAELRGCVDNAKGALRWYISMTRNASATLSAFLFGLLPLLPQS